MIRPLLSAGCAMLSLFVLVACSTSTPRHDPASASVQYPAKQEVIPDFGRFVPAYEAAPADAPKAELQRVTTAVPWGRGMTTVDGELIVLSRGRHRGEGGPTPKIIDHAGVLWKVDTSAAEPVVPGQWAGKAVRGNATPWVEPTSPPFHLYDFQGSPETDIMMTRPYCALAFDEKSRNLFVCAYAGAELSTGFRKHATDAVFRYDLRSNKWHVVEKHNPDVVPRDELKAVISNAYYPHHDPATNPPPHGWTNGADGCAAVGEFLYVPAKDNHLIVQYELDGIRRSPDAGPPQSLPVIGSDILLRHPGGKTPTQVFGPSAVASDDKHMYICYRTSSVVIRVDLDEQGDVVRNNNGTVEADLIAVFEPWNADTKSSGNLYDMSMAPDGDLFVSLGKEGKIWRVTPDPAKPFYGNDRTDRPTTTAPYLNMSELVGRKTGCNNIYASPDGWLYVSSRSNDNGEGNIHGTIYRARILPRS